MYTYIQMSVVLYPYVVSEEWLLDDGVLSTTLRKNQATHTEKPAHEFSSISQTCVYYVDLSLNKPF